MTELPRAARPFVEFPAILRAHGFAVAPDQTVGFIEAIGLLGPRDIEDIRRAGVAMLVDRDDVVPHERAARHLVRARVRVRAWVRARYTLTQTYPEPNPSTRTGHAAPR